MATVAGGLVRGLVLGLVRGLVRGLVVVGSNVEVLKSC
jgi:hypothetical protein